MTFKSIDTNSAHAKAGYDSAISFYENPREAFIAPKVEEVKAKGVSFYNETIVPNVEFAIGAFNATSDLFDTTIKFYASVIVDAISHTSNELKADVIATYDELHDGIHQSTEKLSAAAKASAKDFQDTISQAGQNFNNTVAGAYQEVKDSMRHTGEEVAFKILPLALTINDLFHNELVSTIECAYDENQFSSTL